MNRLNEQEHGERKQKGITLKFAVQKEDNNDDTETLTLLTRKFSKFLNKMGKDRGQP